MDTMEEPVELGATTIDDIPEELLEEILKYLPTSPDLLKTARLVSWKWRVVATPICRHRSLSFTEIGTQHLEEISKSILAYSWNVPWSGVTFTVGNPFPRVYPAWVLRDFGVHLWRLKSDRQNWGNLLNFLQFTPNLRTLVVKSSDDLFPRIPSILILPQLKCLKINLTSETLGFFRFLYHTSCGIRLNKLKLKLDLREVDIETARKLMSILNTFSIATIFLKIVSWPDSEEEVLKVIAAGNLKLRKLNLRFNEPAPDNGTFLDAVGRMLEASSKSLRSFKMNYVLTGECITALHFPILPVLKILKIQFSDNSLEIPNEFTWHLFSSVQTKNFPALQKISVKNRMETFWEDTHELFNRQQCRFETVRELELAFDDSDLSTDWIGIFPNIKILRAVVLHKGLSYILKNMQNLEYLELYFCGNLKNSSKLNSILSGVPGADEVYKENEELIARHRELYGRPSLLSFSLLKTFKLNCRPEDGLGLRDSGAYLSILPLQPLDLLFLSNVDLSSACAAGLRGRHRVVEINGVVQ